MGQSSSRPQASLPTASDDSSPPPAITTGQPEPPIDVGAGAGAVAQNPSSSKPSSFRKSVLKFIKPSNIRSRVNSAASNPRDLRRSWRNSQRWSKAQPDAIPAPADMLPPSPSDGSIAGPSTLPSSSTDKGKQRERTLEEDEEYHSSKAISVAPTPQLPTVVQLPDVDSVESSSLETIAADALEMDLRATESSANPVIHISEPGSDVANHDAPSDPESERASPASLSESQGPAQQQQQPAPLPRQFPPPGTLVVVQGIVHTTDVSRPAVDPVTSSPAAADNAQPSSVPRPESRLDSAGDQGASRTINRLSALLRPRSISSRRTSTIINDPAVLSSPEVDSPVFSGSESPTTSAESFQTRATTPTNEPIHTSQDQPFTTERSLPTTESRSPAISSSSIDVLGTLLSVAAAATAASLLTGSSEPILSSGLAPATANTSSPFPTSTPSTTSLPNLPPYPGFPTPDAIFPDVSAASRAERMREAWGTIRQRLGLRPSPGPPGGPTINQRDGHGLGTASSAQLGDGPAFGPLTDTRELMLAEMARAFNIGLGLNGLGGMPGSNNEANATPGESITGITLEDSPSPEVLGTAPQAATMPPEGSFERFLVDLQLDLRIALTQEPRDPDGEAPQPEVPLRAPQGSNLDQTFPTVGASASSASEPQNNLAQTQGSQQSDDVQPQLQQPDGDSMDMPPLVEVSDSESESDEAEDEDEGYEDDDFHSAEDSAPSQGRAEPSNAQNRTPTSGTGRIDASGRINWWRLYRFPPIVSPRLETLGTRTPFFPGTTPASASASASAPLPAANPPVITTAGSPDISTATPSLQSLPTGSSAPSGTTPTRDASSQLPPHSVVPVIVVGLQSVNSDWRPDLPLQGENDPIDFFGQPASENLAGESENGEEDDLDGWGGQHHTGPEPFGTGLNGGRRRGRARGWHSRAANVIRNLRPGRRNAENPLAAQTSMMAPGSRTFLIYVIGGYYPPDHSIVTGGPNILDSFEALLELADLLGQVRPPTASKDDIEKSGLEIISASELAQHEKDGKISSNCTDRCLICLDDYEPEDRIRVMSCRHAFHKGCVDEWLQKGRNNCPACRSTGVNTDGHYPSMPLS